jgi:hypothetical protein
VLQRRHVTRIKISTAAAAMMHIATMTIRGPAEEEEGLFEEKTQ